MLLAPESLDSETEFVQFVIINEKILFNRSHWIKKTFLFLIRIDSDFKNGQWQEIIHMAQRLTIPISYSIKIGAFCFYYLRFFGKNVNNTDGQKYVSTYDKNKKNL